MALSNMKSKYMALSKTIVEAVCCKDCYKNLPFLNLILPQILLIGAMALTMNLNFTIIVNTLTHNITSFENNSKLTNSPQVCSYFKYDDKYFYKGCQNRHDTTILCWASCWCPSWHIGHIHRLMDKSFSLPLGCPRYVCWLKKNSIATWLVIEVSISCH